MKPAALFLFVALLLIGSSIQAQPIATARTFRGLPIWSFRGFNDSLPIQNTSSEVVQVIGNKIVLYKQAYEPEKRKIVLPKA